MLLPALDTRMKLIVNAPRWFNGINLQIAGQNFPEKTDDFPDWPTNYIPIPVHTVDYSTDYVSLEGLENHSDVSESL